ncbi:HAMP domain-containing histidine kinase [Hymenobacter aerilatus]|uniref:histidine kinase n=1 Tax=Hymenobacter aerilatus TaxID=2932251 RepID=A0A8T9SWF3_9BACT|nr:HAMP domain-containing sensor histidine kinase [Hymenobacter aerilatus]UOR05741.1 HAMP domain-containing histidine kinase [Hymenobacter aerilatus]
MKSNRFFPLFLLLAAVLCFAGAYVSNQYAQRSGSLFRADALRLQNLLTEAELTARYEAETVVSSLRQYKPTFGELVSSTTYPCFVYEGEELVSWSDHTLEPDQALVDEQFREKMVEMRFGHYLVLRQVLGPYTVITYVPLEQHYGISNRYLRNGAGQALFRGMNIRLVPTSASPRLPRLYTDAGDYLFSVESLQPNPITGKYLPCFLLLLGLGCYLLCWWQMARRRFQAGKALSGAIVVILALVVLRAALLFAGLPFSLIELPLFDPRVYAASWLSPSLGDLLINALLLLVGAYYALLLFRRYRIVRRVRQVRSQLMRLLLGVVAVLGYFGLMVLLYQFFSNSFNNSQLVLDITQSIQVSGFKVLLCLALVLHGGAYMVGFFLLSQLFTASVRPTSKLSDVVLLSFFMLLFLPTGLILNQPYLTLLGLALLFFAVLRLTGLKQLVNVVPYQIYLFIFLMLAVISAVGALALYEFADQQLILSKQKVAGNLLIDNDLQGEYLLAERTRHMAADPRIQKVLANPFANQEVVRQKIDKYYLRDYFDKYEVAVTLFGPSGTTADSSIFLPALRRRLLANATLTDQKGIYLIRGSNSFSTRRYVALVPVPADSSRESTIVLELSLKKLTAYSVVPELLIDQKFFQPGLGPELSYAGYENNQLVYSEGDFDYVNQLTNSVLNDSRLYSSGLAINGFHHLGVKGPQQRLVIVTTPTYSFGNWLANFSFLFLLHTFFWLVCIGIYTLAQGHSLEVFRTNFSTKIQLFLNFGILVPLLIVSVATASQVTSSYKRDLLRAYERRGKAVQESLLRNRAILTDSANHSAIIDLAENVASITDTDLNLYDAHGMLQVSSQPLIFEAGLLSPLMNPQAMASLAEHGQPRKLLTEHAGTLSFNALYLPLRAGTVRAGKPAPVIGYVGIPFFDSEKDLDGKLIELISTSLNIFTVMFILFLILTFVASRILTAPLKLITAKLKQTTLTDRNELLEYNSADEIGLLVREYNGMLMKLEASKLELAAQEKEAAWREMARQVAHEIKNPLTPMKLSLQYLQKAIAEHRPNVQELIGKISQTLITQIDVLSDIATSFSTFTNLPAMRPERLDIIPILRRCVSLHQSNAIGGHLYLLLPDDADSGNYEVFADENLLVRTFNNLLINALQAVPPGQHPDVGLWLEYQPDGQHLLICVQDNGAGIPLEVQDKIFKPNFTTKEQGSGIGLAVARRGIESAGGRIWFETEEEVGTTFFVELPLAPEKK